MHSMFSSIILVSIIYYANCCRSSNDYFPSNGAKALAVLKGVVNDSKISGTIFFEQQGYNSPVFVTVNITGIPNGLGPKHGLHVHQSAITSTSDLTADICGSAAGHFNPLNKTHGDILAATRHVGDYGNILSSNGNILYKFNDTVSSLYGFYGVIGRTIVLHQLEDDLGLQNNTGSMTTGNAGARIACGVIGILP